MKAITSGYCFWSQLDAIVDDNEQSVLRTDGNRDNDGGLLGFCSSWTRALTTVREST